MKMLVLVAALLAAGASHADPASEGTVESVREVQLPPSSPLAAVLEHPVRPQTGEQLVVRLDDGRAITLVRESSAHVNPGQRVRLLAGGDDVRIVDVSCVLPM